MPGPVRHPPGGSAGEEGATAAACLSFPESAPIPDNIKKYRKSYFAEAGSRVVHPGLVEDVKKIDPMTKFGIVKEKGENVEQLFAPSQVSEVTDLVQKRNESMYRSARREPLGKGFVRGHVLPEKMKSPDYRFGIKADAGVDCAKGLLYVQNNVDETQFKELYVKSHNALDPGEQRNRHYDWEKTSVKDPSAYVFGRTGGPFQSPLLSTQVQQALQPEKEDTIRKTKITTKQVEDLKSSKDQLGKARALGAAPQLPEDYVFGELKSKRGAEGNAGDCLRGPWTAEEQDEGLGKATTPGWRNVTADTRVFGVPSIRHDVDPPARKSIADSQNYGDDLNAEYLLYPEPFASRGVTDQDFVMPRPREDVFGLFQRLGFTSDPELFALLWRCASLQAVGAPDSPELSIQSVRAAYNEYLEKKDEGESELQDWIAKLSLSSSTT